MTIELARPSTPLGDAIPVGNLVHRLRIPFTEWAAADFPQPPTIIRGLLHHGINIAGGEPGTYKTWFAMHVAVAVASGRPLFGRYPIDRPGRVLYIGYEGHPGANRDRLVSITRSAGMEPVDLQERLDVIWAQEGTQVDAGSEFHRSLIDAAPEYALIVLDVLWDAWSGDPIDNKQVNRELKPMVLQPIVDRGASWLIVHHASKANEANKGRRIGQNFNCGQALLRIRDSIIELVGKSNDPAVRVRVQVKDGKAVDPFILHAPEAWATSSSSAGLTWAPEEDRAGVDYAPAIMAYVENHPGCSKNAIDKGVTGSRSALLACVDQLAAGDKPKLVHIVGDGYYCAGSEPVRNHPEPLAPEGGSTGSPLQGGRTGNHPPDEEIY